MILIQKDNYSEFCREAIIEKVHRESSDQYIDSQIESLQNQIKELKEKKKSNRENPEEVKKILEMAQNLYSDYTNDPGMTISNFKTYIRSNILPKLKKAHCSKYDIDSLLEMCSKGDIHV